jgi:hypothetical protein
MSEDALGSASGTIGKGTPSFQRHFSWNSGCYVFTLSNQIFTLIAKAAHFAIRF